MDGQSTADEDQDWAVLGVVLMGLILLGAVAAAALPMLAGFVVAAYLPGVGGARTDGSAWQLLHLLWMYPMFALCGTVVDAIVKHRGHDRTQPRVWLVEGLLMWAALALMFHALFERPMSAAIGAAVALVLYAPFVHFLERGTTDASRKAMEGEASADGA